MYHNVNGTTRYNSTIDALLLWTSIHCDTYIWYFICRLLLLSPTDVIKSLLAANTGKSPRNFRRFVVLSFLGYVLTLYFFQYFLYSFNHFSSSYQEPNTERILYGLDDIKQARDVIIVCSRFAMRHFPFFFCVAYPFGPEFTIYFTNLYFFLKLQVEGEIDKLSMEEAGYRNCVSVPDGAPPQVSNKLPDKDHVRTIT